jgi:hypothetical protein
MAESDWPLDTLAAERGARAAYRITHGAGQVRVEGRQGARTCVLEAETANGAARRLLAGPALYQLQA